MKQFAAIAAKLGFHCLQDSVQTQHTRFKSTKEVQPLTISQWILEEQQTNGVANRIVVFEELTI